MRRSLLIAVALGVGVLAVVVGAQIRGGTASGKVMTLTPLDYIEIRQLAARYGHAVDQGADNGYAYADLFAADGTFGQTRGRDELASNTWPSRWRSSTSTVLLQLPVVGIKMPLEIGELRGQDERTSPTVPPSASTVSCWLVYGRNGVGIRTLWAISTLPRRIRTGRLANATP